MKKFIALCLVLAMAATLFAGCGVKKTATLEGTPAEIIEKIYAQKSVEFAPMTLTPDDPDYGSMWDWNYYTGLADGSKVKEAAVSEPMIGSIAHEVILVEVPEGTDPAEVAAQMEANMNPRKWICVEAEATWVKTSGQYVVMVMSTADMAAAIEANFNTAFGA